MRSVSFCIKIPPVEKLSLGGVFVNKYKWIGPALAGFGAGAVNGLFGIGGGMILIPLLGLLTDWEDEKIFASSLSIILPICLVTLTATSLSGPIAWWESVPYLIGSTVGGVLAGFWGRKIPVQLLHKALGILIIWGGIRYLWP